MEDCCSYELSKLLREKGFRGECLMMYLTPKHGNTTEHRLAPHGRDSSYYDGYSYQCEAPSHQAARKWLRETHRIDIVIEISDPSAKDRKYYCMIWDGNNNSYILDLFNTYEKACEAAIKYCLENEI